MLIPEHIQALYDEAPYDQPISTAQVYDERQLLICSVCGHFNTHIEVVDVVTPSGSLRVSTHGEDDSSYITTESKAAQDRGRRNVIVLHVRCENQHHYGVSFQQHKGETYVRRHQWVSATPGLPARSFPPVATPSPHDR